MNIIFVQSKLSSYRNLHVKYILITYNFKKLVKFWYPFVKGLKNGWHRGRLAKKCCHYHIIFLARGKRVEDSFVRPCKLAG